MDGLTLVTGPAEEPVSLAELKKWLRVDHDTDNDTIADLNSDAREMCEEYTGRQFALATWKLTSDGFSGSQISLPRSPLVSVSSVVYWDNLNVSRTLAAATYEVDAKRDPGSIFLADGYAWPQTYLRNDAVAITFVAGYGAASTPRIVKRAIKFAVASWYEGRENGTLPDVVVKLLRLNWTGVLR